MIIEAYKYKLDELYMGFKNDLHDLLYNAENDEDVTNEEVLLFKLYMDQLKDDG